jgi:hypothetical protein
MTSENHADTSVDSEVEEIRAVVPPRAVLTELARGFLLVHESNPARAVRFAETFLKEQVGRVAAPRVEPVPQLTLARLSLGRFHHGPVEPAGWPADP